jgi:phenylacetic acid degradation operon negative regulatory protein
LLSGLAFGYSVTPGQQKMVIGSLSREWKKINERELREGVKYLYKLNLISKNEGREDFVKIFLTEKGRLKALESKLMGIKNKKEKWDGKWRMVAFDIPEKYRIGRDALRRKLKLIGFCELQKSVFVTHYNCKSEIKLLVDFFKLDKYVRFGILEMLDNEDYLKNFFKL